MGCGPSKQQLVVSSSPQNQAPPSASQSEYQTPSNGPQEQSTAEKVASKEHSKTLPPSTGDQEHPSAGESSDVTGNPLQHRSSSTDVKRDELQDSVEEFAAVGSTAALLSNEHEQQIQEPSEKNQHDNAKIATASSNGVRGLSDAAMALGNIMHSSLNKVSHTDKGVTSVQPATINEPINQSEEAHDKKKVDNNETASKNLAQVLISGEKISLAVEPTIVTDRVISVNESTVISSNAASENPSTIELLQSTVSKNSGQTAEFSSTLDARIDDNISTVSMRTEQNIPVQNGGNRAGPPIHGAASERDLKQHLGSHNRSTGTSDFGIFSNVQKLSKNEALGTKTPPNSVDVVGLPLESSGVDMKNVLEKITEIGHTESGPSQHLPADTQLPPLKKSGAQSQTTLRNHAIGGTVEQGSVSGLVVPHKHAALHRIQNQHSTGGLHSDMAIISTPSRLSGLDGANSATGLRTPANSVDIGAPSNLVITTDMKVVLEKVIELAADHSEVKSDLGPIGISERSRHSDKAADNYQSAREQQPPIKVGEINDKPPAEEEKSSSPTQDLEAKDVPATTNVIDSSDPNKRLSQILMSSARALALKKVGESSNTSIAKAVSEKTVPAVKQTVHDSAEPQSVKLPDSDTSVQNMRGSDESEKFESAKGSIKDVKSSTKSAENSQSSTQVPGGTRRISSSSGTRTSQAKTAAARASSASSAADAKRKNSRK